MAHRQTSLSSVSADLLPTGFRAIARPDKIRFSDALPKTRSGKIMRRLLRSLAAGEAVSGDTSTLEDRSVLDKLREGA